MINGPRTAMFTSFLYMDRDHGVYSLFPIQQLCESNLMVNLYFHTHAFMHSIGKSQ